MIEKYNALIASQNEIKRLAVEDGLRRFMPPKVAINVALSRERIESNVCDQPLSLTEGFRGVHNRLEAIRSISGFAIYTAVEGTAHQVDDNWFEVAIAGIWLPGDTVITYGMGPGYPIPPKIARHLEQGLDLNQAMEIETGITEIGKKQGFNGWLTDNQIDRRTSSAEAVVMALHGHKHLEPREGL